MQDHYVRRTLLHHHPELEAQLDYLSLKTKNQPFRMKDESSGQLIREILTSSPKVGSVRRIQRLQNNKQKASVAFYDISRFFPFSLQQYIVTTAPKEDRWAFPVMSESHVVLSKKVKGLY